MKFTQYDDVGCIIQSGFCQPETLHLYGNTIEGEYSEETHFIENKIAKLKPDKPNEWSEFDYVSKTWKPNLIVAGNLVRSERTRLLVNSDWTQLPDVPLETKAAWSEYRQLLRDITGQQGYPTNVIWPTKPT